LSLAKFRLYLTRECRSEWEPIPLSRMATPIPLPSHSYSWARSAPIAAVVKSRAPLSSDHRVVGQPLERRRRHREQRPFDQGQPGLEHAAGVPDRVQVLLARVVLELDDDVDALDAVALLQIFRELLVRVGLGEGRACQQAQDQRE
jgi:hypothetical protein